MTLILNRQGFDLQLPDRRLQVLQDMCFCSDRITYFLKNSAGFLGRGDIREVLTPLKWWGTNIRVSQGFREPWDVDQRH